MTYLFASCSSNCFKGLELVTSSPGFKRLELVTSSLEFVTSSLEIVTSRLLKRFKHRSNNKQETTSCEIVGSVGHVLVLLETRVRRRM